MLRAISLFFIMVALASATTPSAFTPTLRGASSNPGLATTVIDGNFTGIANNANWCVATLTNSATLSAAMPDETGGGYLVFNNNPTLVGATFSGALASSSTILTSGNGIGYATGAGGVVTQATSRTTGVTLSKPTGQITLYSASLAANTAQSFVLTNTTIAATDIVVANHISGGTLGLYNIAVTAAAGSATITLRNNSSSASPTEAPVIQFVVIKGAIN